MRKCLKIITLILIVSVNFIAAQSNPDATRLYKWEYSISYLNIPSTDLTFLINESFMQEDRKLLRIDITAKTYGVLSRFFWVDNQYTVLIEPESYLPISLSKRINQKNIQQNWTIHYDNIRNLAWLDSGSSWTISPDCHNFFSMLFFLRLQPLESGERYSLNLDVEQLAWGADISVKKKII